MVVAQQLLLLCVRASFSVVNFLSEIDVVIEVICLIVFQ